MVLLLYPISFLIMEYWFLVLGAIFAIVGLVGAIVPALPGPPLSYVTLWMMWLFNRDDVSTLTLVVMGILMILITILDYVAPVWLTKFGKGTKAGIRGATAGLIVGFFFGPLGLIFGPFIGALLGELLVSTPFATALKVAFMSFLAFVLTTALKVVYCAVIIGMFVKMLVVQFV